MHRQSLPDIQVERVYSNQVSNLLRSDPGGLPLLTGKINIPALPMWLAAHSEIRSKQRIRVVCICWQPACRI